MKGWGKDMVNTHLTKEFRIFAKDCNGSSPLYEFLSLQISMDTEMLALSAHSQKGQPVPNLFLASVHHLLLNGKAHRLSEYYPNIVAIPKDSMQSFSHFKDFCRLYREEIITLLQTKLVQTNEVRRCAYLYPAFSYIYNQTQKPLALIEIGTSAGFQLLWDKYSYSYQSSTVYGEPKSIVPITSEIRGANKPHLPQLSPPVTHRIGMDLHVNDVSNREDYLWLLSLIWPEHDERRVLFKQAARAVQAHKVNLIEGNAVKLLPEIVDQIPGNSSICIFHTHVANQMPVEMKHELLANIGEIGRLRDVFHLYNNMWDGKLHLDYFLEGVEHNKVVGETDSHGKWFTWNL